MSKVTRTAKDGGRGAGRGAGRRAGTRAQAPCSQAESSFLATPLPAPESKALPCALALCGHRGLQQAQTSGLTSAGLESWEAQPAGTFPLPPSQCWCLCPSPVAREERRRPQGTPLAGGGGGLGVGVPTADFACHPETHRESDGGGNPGSLGGPTSGAGT